MESSLALLQDPVAWAALATLVAMEIVLGIDNLIFISILTNKLPEAMREKARRVGIGLALILRLALLATIAVIVTLTEPLFTVLGRGISWRGLILIAGGAFLVWKATREIHHHVSGEPEGEDSGMASATQSFASAIGQILVLDLVFSIDSIITAVGMTEHVEIMFIAVIAAVTAMLFAATPLANFINRNPTIVMLALAFLMMIGMTLVAEGLGSHVPKGYIYTAMAFSAAVEGLNMISRKRRAQRRARAAE
ncbi:TerC family protein [Cupriavidus sp. WKF15]|uniref:TerC family protein n=1 Tax=Cupriavidus sp. WKF15 TaxID=3032282 RepID=UPI0023E2B691|nr:TerC family protein [Cupriavidus sp. WKF15]WER48831.1 TerC family protein [Cupriavidus sp. WKF15]